MTRFCTHTKPTPMCLACFGDLRHLLREALDVTVKTYDSGLRRDDVTRGLIEKLEVALSPEASPPKTQLAQSVDELVARVDLATEHEIMCQTWIDFPTQDNEGYRPERGGFKTGWNACRAAALAALKYARPTKTGRPVKGPMDFIGGVCTECKSRLEDHKTVYGERANGSMVFGAACPTRTKTGD